jgi:hypothetical protein
VCATTLEEKDELGTAWETRAVLILWLSILVLIPFDLVTVDSLARDDGDDAEAPPVVMRILRLCQDRYLSDPGIVRDRAATLLARLLTRPDMPRALARFLDWATEALANANAPRAAPAPEPTGNRNRNSRTETAERAKAFGGGGAEGDVSRPGVGARAGGHLQARDARRAARRRRTRLGRRAGPRRVAGGERERARSATRLQTRAEDRFAVPETQGGGVAVRAGSALARGQPEEERRGRLGGRRDRFGDSDVERINRARGGGRV